MTNLNDGIQTSEAGNAGSKTTDATASFESLLNESLLKQDVGEASSDLPHSNKPQIAPVTQKPLQTLTTGVVAPVAVKLPNQDVLPLVFNFSLALASPKQISDRTNSAGENYLAQSKADPPKLTLAGPSAFTAKVQVSDQPAFAIPSAVPGGANPTVSEADSKKDGLASVALKASGIAQSNISENTPGELTNTVQAVVNSTSNPQSASIISKESAPVNASLLVNESARIDETSAVPAASATPLKEISFQLPGTRGVEVRLTETAGQVRVDVRSADSALTQDLRGNLHELVNALEKKGLSSEITHPVDGSTLRTGDLNGTRNSSSNSQDEASGRQQQGGEQQGRGQQERQRQQEQSWDGRPQKERATAWNDAIDSHLATSHLGKI